MVSDDLMEKHLIWAATVSKRISKIDDLFGVNYVFLWTVPSKSTFLNLKSISEELTLPEILGKTVSIIRVVAENEFMEDKLAGLLKTYAKERKLNFSKYMKFLRTVLSGQKVRLFDPRNIFWSETRLETALSHLKSQRIAGIFDQSLNIMNRRHAIITVARVLQ